MIDPRRVTPAFLFAYVKWAVPIILSFVVLIFSVTIMISALGVRRERIDAESTEIAKLQNELQANRATTETSNVAVAEVAADPAVVERDRDRINHFVETLFNFTGEDDFGRVVAEVESVYGTPKDSQGLASLSTQLTSTGHVSLDRVEPYCENISGMRYVWFALVDFKEDDVAKQCWMILSMDDDTIDVTKSVVMRTDG